MVQLVSSAVTPLCVFTDLYGPDAYQYGNTIIVEDEDGEVVKKYDIPVPEKKRRHGNKDTSAPQPDSVRDRLQRMGTWAHIHSKESAGESGGSSKPEDQARIGPRSKLGKSAIVDDDDDRLRFTITSGGRRMSKNDFIKQIQSLDPKARAKAVEESDAPEGVKEDARRHAAERGQKSEQKMSDRRRPPPLEDSTSYKFPVISQNDKDGGPAAVVEKVASHEDRPKGDDGLTLVDSNGQNIPFHSVSDSVSKYSAGQPETAASRRRRLASRKDSDDDGTMRVPPSSVYGPSSPHTTLHQQASSMAAGGETDAERRRRLAALGEDGDQVKDSDSEDDGEERKPTAGHQPVAEPNVPSRIRFADSPAVSQGRVQWSEDVGRRGRPR